MKRRDFLHGMAISMPFGITPIRARGLNEQLQIAAIGVGGKGGSDFHHLARHGRVVAACDVDQSKLDYALRTYPKTSRFSDYREMLSQFGDQIDVLSISTPDHTHAHAAQLAMKKDIHLFVQAPLAHTVAEARLIKKLAQEKRLCSQLGLQGCSSDTFRDGVEFLQSGMLGKIEEVHIWAGKAQWLQAPDWINRPTGTDPVPTNLNWDCFLGPAPQRPYHKAYQPYKWRGWRDFGTGTLGSYGVHLFNLPFMGCKLKFPQSVECLHRGPVNQETFSSWGTLRFEVYQESTKQLIPVYWYEGRIGHLSKESTGTPNYPPASLFCGRQPATSGSLIRGTEGTFYAPSSFGDYWEVYREKKWHRPEELKFPRGALDRNGRGDSGMKDELIQAIRTQKPDLALAGFEHGSSLTELALLGNAALFLGGKSSYDHQLGRTERKDINQLLTKSYRAGWGIN